MSALPIRRRGTAVALALAATAALVLPVAGVNQVTVMITAGSRTASVADVALGTVTFSHSAQTTTGNMTLTADDSSGSGAGWHVTVQSSDFVYSGPNPDGVNIPAANFSITTANAPTLVAGEAINIVGGPKVPLLGATGALNTARETLEAELTFGEGTYSQVLASSLSVPAGSRVGTYTATLTVTISAGP